MTPARDKEPSATVDGWSAQNKRPGPKGAPGRGTGPRFLAGYLGVCQYPTFREHQGSIYLTVTQGPMERIMFGKLE